jgi:hypothetical protein
VAKAEFNRVGDEKLKPLLVSIGIVIDNGGSVRRALDALVTQGCFLNDAGGIMHYGQNNEVLTSTRSLNRILGGCGAPTKCPLRRPIGELGKLHILIGLLQSGRIRKYGAPPPPADMMQMLPMVVPDNHFPPIQSAPIIPLLQANPTDELPEEAEMEMFTYEEMAKILGKADSDVDVLPLDHDLCTDFLHQIMIDAPQLSLS